MEAELRLEKMSKKQELQEREKEITEHKRELESVQTELLAEKQKMQSLQEVNIYKHFGTLIFIIM